MTEPVSGQVTRLLTAMRDGCEVAADELLSLVYNDLQNVARRQMANVPPSDTLQPTALVHEAYIRLVGKAGVDIMNRKQFFHVAARAMHDILVEQARRHEALKYGGGRQRLSLDDDAAISADSTAQQLVALRDALTKLELIDRTSAEVVRLRYIAGLTRDETAAVMDLSPATVSREWAFARSWLHREITAEME